MAHRAFRVVVLHHPAQLGALAVAQGGKTLGTVLRAGAEVPGPLHAHPPGPQRQHQRGFHVAGVDAEAVLLGTETRVDVLPLCVQQRQVEPVDAVDQQPQARAQVARHQVERAHLAAVAVEQHQLAHAAGGHTLTDLGPDAHQRLGLERERAGKAGVLGRKAHRLGGQEQRGQVGRDVRQCRRHHAVDDIRVHRQRQVRAVLLGRRHRQHRDGTGAVE